MDGGSSSIVGCAAFGMRESTAFVVSHTRPNVFAARPRADVVLMTSHGDLVDAEVVGDLRGLQHAAGRAAARAQAEDLR